MRQFLGQGHRDVGCVQSLIRVTEQPQAHARVDPAAHPRVVAAIDKGVVAVFVDVV